MNRKTHSIRPRSAAFSFKTTCSSLLRLIAGGAILAAAWGLFSTLPSSQASPHAVNAGQLMQQMVWNPSPK